MDHPPESSLPGGPAVDAAGIIMVLLTICVFILPVLIFFPPMLPSRSEALLQTHTPLGLDPRQSRLGRRHEPRNPGADKTLPARLRSLWIYPIKSCKGIELTESRVLPTGLEFDRLFTFAQLKSPFPVRLDTPEEEKSRHQWHFITQREYPLLATIQVDLFVPDLTKIRGHEAQDDDASSEAFIVLRFPWVDRGWLGNLAWLVAKLSRGWRALPEKEVVLPVAFPDADEIEERRYSFDEVTIWRQPVTALNMESELPRELRLYLGVSNKLGIFRIDPARLRPIYRCAPAEAEAGYQPCVGFQDAYPLHLLNLSSVRDLESKIPKDDDLRHLDPRRFRANLIIDGPAAYEEDSWKEIRFTPAPSSVRGAAESPRFHVSCRTVRCKLPNVDPDTGFRHPAEPDRAMRKHREVDEGAKGKGCLGMQLTPLYDEPDAPMLEGWLEVGMGVEVLGTGEHLYIPSTKNKPEFQAAR
ncbi:putative molybdenum ion binding protein [Podospora conica]|nr:putative molybdenum ion binding protein [Schizothecium conicum]